VSGGWPGIRLLTCWLGVAREWRALAGHRVRGVAREGIAKLEVALPSSLVCPATREEAVVPKVVIGVDPHKRVNAVVVLNSKGMVLARQQFANTADGFRELKVFWRQWRPRTWAVEGCNGVGKYLAQRLLAEGERVLDVSISGRFCKARRGRRGCLWSRRDAWDDRAGPINALPPRCEAGMRRRCGDPVTVRGRSTPLRRKCLT
jgi:hypothetical protein